MMRFFCGCLLFWGAHTFAHAGGYPVDYSLVFEDLLINQEEIVCSTYPCSSSDICGSLTSRPIIPALAQQSADLEHVPVLLINNTGLPDDEVYFTLYGKPVDGAPSGCQTNTNFAFVSFPDTPVGEFVAPPGGVGQTSAYSYKFSDIPLSGGQRTIYVPYVNAGILLFSIGPLTLNTNVNSIAAPVPTNPMDPAYNTVYGAMEISFFPSDCTNPVLNQLTIDFTCVDYYGLSMYLNLFTQNPLPGIPQNRPSGLYQSRHYTLCNLLRTLATASPAARSQWESLVLRDAGGKILRVVSPGYAMSHADAGGTFDQNYFDNDIYGFNWRNNVWNGTYYEVGQHELSITTHTATYVGHTTGTSPVKTFDFVKQSNTDTIYQIPWVTIPSPGPSDVTTSRALFNVAVHFPEMQVSSDGGISFSPVASSDSEAEEITKQLSSAIVAGLIPGKVTSLPEDGFSLNTINTYYTSNANLTNVGATGPWFDLYSLGLLSNTHLTGNAVYTYPYDDYLYSQATIDVAPSQATIDETTYVTVVLGHYSDR